MALPAETSEILRSMFPEADPLTDWAVEQFPGESPQIVQWHYAGADEPTEAEILAARDAYLLASAKAAAKAQAASDFAAYCTAGLDAGGGYPLKCGIEDVTLFTGRVVLLQQAIAGGLKTTEDQTFLIDANGTKHTMTVGACLSMITQLGLLRDAASESYNDAMTAINAAQTAADVNAVTWPGKA